MVKSLQKCFKAGCECILGSINREHTENRQTMSKEVQEHTFSAHIRTVCAVSQEVGVCFVALVITPASSRAGLGWKRWIGQNWTAFVGLFVRVVNTGKWSKPIEPYLKKAVLICFYNLEEHNWNTQYTHCSVILLCYLLSPLSTAANDHLIS